MTDINLICIQSGIFKAETDQDVEALKRFKLGDVMRVNPTRDRNPKFHRKMFALLNLGYDSFETAAEWKGEVIKKNFDRFREDVTILAGYYEMTVDINNEPKAKAKSISFAKMSEDDFEDLYSKVADVILTRVLKNYTRDDLDNVINQILGFV